MNPHACGSLAETGFLLPPASEQLDKQRAAELYLEAIDLFTQAGDKDLAKHTYTALSKLKLKQRDIVGAMTAFDSGLEQLDKPNLIERMARKIIGGGSVKSDESDQEEEDKPET